MVEHVRICSTSISFLKKKYGLCKNFYLFIWLRWVLIVVRRIFSWGLWILLVVACDLEFPDQELNPGPVLGAWSLSHWTTREVPSFYFLWKFIEQMMVTFIRVNEGHCWHCYWTKLKSVHPTHSKAESVDTGLCWRQARSLLQGNKQGSRRKTAYPLSLSVWVSDFLKGEK